MSDFWTYSIFELLLMGFTFLPIYYQSQTDVPLMSQFSPLQHIAEVEGTNNMLDQREVLYSWASVTPLLTLDIDPLTQHWQLPTVPDTQRFDSQLVSHLKTIHPQSNVFSNNVSEVLPCNVGASEVTVLTRALCAPFCLESNMPRFAMLAGVHYPPRATRRYCKLYF